MCREAEQQKIRTQFEFKDNLRQPQEFEHSFMRPQELQAQVKAARDSEAGFLNIRRQLSGVSARTGGSQTVIQAARPQVQQPQAAPKETTWKERRAQKKQQKKALKRGRELTREADALTADLAMCQRRINESPDRFVAPEGEENQGLEGLTKVLRSMQSVTVSADQFTDAQLPKEYAALRDALDKSAYIARMAQDEALMEQLKATDLVLYATALRWRDTEPELRQLFRLANHCHGLKENGEPMKDEELSESRNVNGVEEVIPNLVHHARNRFGAALEDFRGKLAERETARQTLLTGLLEQSCQQELEQVKQETLQYSYTGDPETVDEHRWISSPSIRYGSPDNLERIQKIKTLIEENGQRYQENKELVDRMYSDVIRRYEVLGELRAQLNVWCELQNRYQRYQGEEGGDGNRLWRMAGNRVDALMKDSVDVGYNLTSINNTLTRLLKGGESNPLEKAVLTRYDPSEVQSLASIRGRRTKWQSEELERIRGLTEDGKPVFQPTAPESPYLTRAAELFRQGEDAGEDNLELLRLLQNHQQEQERKRPVRTAEMGDAEFKEKVAEDQRQRQLYYTALRRRMVPWAERIVNWDMDRFLSMGNAELMNAQGELDELFSGAALTEDLMQLSHPIQNKQTMLDDILRDRAEEFQHKAAILRGLAERSRGLALSVLAEAGASAEECLLPQERTEGPLTAETLRALAEKKMETGKRLVEMEQKRWTDRRTPGSEAFRAACLELSEKKFSQGQLIERPTHLDEVAHKYERHHTRPQPDITPEEAAVLRRLKREEYRVACWDQMDQRVYQKELGDDTRLQQEEGKFTIGESLFRTYSRYVVAAGAQAQTPEEFDQMIRDFSAGTELTRGNATPRQIFEARERNRAGCLQYKETMRLTYDYMARKYGFALETMSVVELYDHWEELLWDFNNLQTDGNMLTKIPDFVDLTQEEDLLLYNQLQYMDALGSYLLAMPGRFVMEGITEEAWFEGLKLIVTGGNFGPAREALKQMGAASGMAAHVTWGSTVQVGQRRRLSQEELDQGREERWQRFQEREEKRKQESRLLREQRWQELREQWKDRNVRYPDDYTAQLYRDRETEYRMITAKRLLVQDELRRHSEKPALSKEMENTLCYLMPAYQADRDLKLKPEDEAAVRKTVRDYLTGKQENRAPLMNQVVESICALELSAEMFYPNYVRAHYVEFRTLDRQLNTMAFLARDNPALFEALPKETRDLWDAVHDFFGLTAVWVTGTMELSGLGVTQGYEINDEPIPEEERMEGRREQEEAIQTLLAHWRETKEAYLRKKEEQ